MSANIGRTISACRQAVVDIRCCLDWLEEQGYEHFGVLGTSLGSCYAFLASAHDARLRVNAFNHASTAFGDVVWAGQSTRHIRQAVEEAGLTQERLRALWAAVSPVSYYEQFAGAAANGPGKNVLARLRQLRPHFSQGVLAQVVEAFRRSRRQLRARACCPAATTPPAKRPTSISTAGTWAGLCIARSRRCAKRRRHQPQPIASPEIEEPALKQQSS